MQRNAIYYHSSNDAPLNCFRYATAKRLGITMGDRILITLVAHDGQPVTGRILSVGLEDGSGKNFLVTMFEKSSGNTVIKFVKDEKPNR